MLIIRKVEIDIDQYELQEIMQKSFKTVADEFDLTKEKAPTNPAYITLEKIHESVESGIEFYIGIENDKKVGCIAIEKDGNRIGNFFIERLAVIPDYRHNRFGEYLLDYAIKEIRKREGKSAGIAIINENRELKDWYIKYGFIEDSIKKYNHLPFTVCFMSMVIT